MYGCAKRLMKVPSRGKLGFRQVLLRALDYMAETRNEATHTVFCKGLCRDDGKDYESIWIELGEPFPLDFSSLAILYGGPRKHYESDWARTIRDSRNNPRIIPDATATIPNHAQNMYRMPNILLKRSVCVPIIWSECDTSVRRVVPVVERLDISVFPSRASSWRATAQ